MSQHLNAYYFILKRLLVIEVKGLPTMNFIKKGCVIVEHVSSQIIFFITISQWKQVAWIFYAMESFCHNGLKCLVILHPEIIFFNQYLIHRNNYHTITLCQYIFTTPLMDQTNFRSRQQSTHILWDGPKGN